MQAVSKVITSQQLPVEQLQRVPPFSQGVSARMKALLGPQEKYNTLFLNSTALRPVCADRGTDTRR